MAYRLYLDNFDDVYKEYLSSKRKGKNYKNNNIFPLKFSISGKVKDNFKIEEIDSLLCMCKNESSFINEFKKYNTSYLTEKEKSSNHIILTNTSNGTIKKVLIIYDDKLLFEQALNTRNAKKSISYRYNNTKANNKILVNSSEKLDNYIEFIKSFVKNDTTRDFILNPNNIPYLYLEDLIDLDSDIFNNVYNQDNSVIVREGLRSLLNKYVMYEDMHKKARKNNQSTITIEEELNMVNDQISIFFRSNYRNLRKMIEWEYSYTKVLSRHLNDKNLSEKEKEIISLQIDKIEGVRELRNGDNSKIDFLFMDEEELYEFYHTSDSNINNYFESEKIEKLYKEGGIQSVMENMDLDEILVYEGDAEKLGILPKKK